MDASSSVDWAEVSHYWSDRGLGILLKCPLCGFDYQHQKQVVEFQREGGEDGSSVVGVPGVQGFHRSDDNPSPRRHAVSIWFEGECGHTWRLDVVQHKGQTFLFAGEVSETMAGRRFALNGQSAFMEKIRS